MNEVKSIVESGYLTGRVLVPTTDLVLSLQKDISNHKTQEIILDYCSIANIGLTLDMFFKCDKSGLPSNYGEDNRIFEGWELEDNSSELCYSYRLRNKCIEYLSIQYVKPITSSISNKGIKLVCIIDPLHRGLCSRGKSSTFIPIKTINHLAEETNSKIKFI